MAKREKKHRQTYPGPNSADNQQMMQDIRETLENHQRRARAVQDETATTGGQQTVPADRSSVEQERPDSRERDQTRRSSPPSELTASNGSPNMTPRMQQNRSTPTKQLASNRTKRQLATIRRSLKPFAYSDPGFHAAKDKVNKRMLEELISLGHNEVSSTSVVLFVMNSSGRRESIALFSLCAISTI